MLSSRTPHAELPGDAWLKSMHAPCQQVQCKCGGTCDEGARPCALQTRAGADRAKAELNGILLHDLELKIGWGKSIVIPPAPLYTAESVGISSAPLKPSGAAVPPPGVDAAPPWTDPHKDDSVKPVGES